MEKTMSCDRGKNYIENFFTNYFFSQTFICWKVYFRLLCPRKVVKSLKEETPVAAEVISSVSWFLD